jgi:hypothetical protein
MRKFYAVVAVAAVMSVASGWAQTTNITQGLDLTITGTLVPGPGSLDNQSLSGSGNTNPISFVHLEIINGSTTNFERWIGQIAGGNTNLYLKEVRHVNLNTLHSSDFAFVFDGSGQVGSSSNAVLFVVGTDRTVTKRVKSGTGHVTVTNEIVKAQMEGIWVENPVDSDEDGGQAVIRGSLNSVKGSGGNE